MLARNLTEIRRVRTTTKQFKVQDAVNPIDWPEDTRDVEVSLDDDGRVRLYFTPHPLATYEFEVYLSPDVVDRIIKARKRK